MLLCLMRLGLTFHNLSNLVKVSLSTASSALKGLSTVFGVLIITPDKESLEN